MSIGLNENKNKQQEQAQPHDTWNARHAHNTHSTDSAGKLTGSIRDTVPRQQDEHEQRQQQQQIPYYFGGILKIRGCLLFVLCPWPKQEKSSLFSDGLLYVKDAHQMDSILDSGLEVKLSQTLADVIIKNQFLILTIDSLH